MQQFQERIQAHTGWSEAIVSAIRSEEEAELYIRAGLKEMRVNGKPALVQPRINLNYVMPEWWVKKYAELTWKQHHEDGNFAILHTFDDYSDIGRADFEKEKKAYWMARYKSIIA